MKNKTRNATLLETVIFRSLCKKIEEVFDIGFRVEKVGTGISQIK